MQLTVLKRSGATEPFNRDKAIAGVRKACKGRPVTDDQLACLGQDVEDALRLSGQAEFAANEVGLAILGPLRELDEVAYLRFASVYRAFESADDFEAEIAMLAARATPPTRCLSPSTDGLTTDRPARRGEAACRAHQHPAEKTRRPSNRPRTRQENAMTETVSTGAAPSSAGARA